MDATVSAENSLHAVNCRRIPSQGRAFSSGGFFIIGKLQQPMRHNLSDVTALIRDRRSISPEQFSDRRVHKEILEEILTNGTWAPTHGMTQPWRFTAYVGEGMAVIGPKLAEWYKSFSGDKFSQAKFEKLQTRGKRVTALVAVGMVPDPNGRIKELEEIEAVACAIQNMALTATGYGIGAFWSTPSFIAQPEVRSFVGLPANGQLLGLVYFGYPAGEWPISHRKPLEYVTTWVESTEVERG